MSSTNLNYVKFVRGTPSAYESLPEKDRNTLYFISEAESEKGILYLGTKIVAGGASISSLKDLKDILITEDIDANSILVFNQGENKWKPVSIVEIFKQIVSVMGGATQDNAGTSGLVPAPEAGKQNAYLKGDGTWSTELQEEISVLVGSDTGKSIKQIASDLFDTRVGNMDKFKEWLENNPNFEIPTDRLERIETVVFDTGVKGSDGFKAGLQTIVGDMSVMMKSYDNKFKEIDARLTWQEIV